MVTAVSATKRGKNSLVLMQRDLDALLQLYLHRGMTSGQFGKLCFSNCGYETARKRIRKLKQRGLIGITSSRRMEGRGRPEQMCFVTTTGAAALGDKRDISSDMNSVGVPHPYLKEHCLQVVDVHLSLHQAEKDNLISDLQWTTGRQLWNDASGNHVNQPDAMARFKNNVAGGSCCEAAIIVDTGNLRQTRHWEPKFDALLRTDTSIWVVTSSNIRILTLRKWSLPLLGAAGADPRRCVFCVFSDLIEKGILAANWVDVHGNKVNP